MSMLALVPLLPLVAGLVLLVVGPRLARSAVAAIGVGAPVASAVLATVAAGPVFADPAAAVSAPLWTWANLPSVTLTLGLRADALSTLMMLTVTWVGSLICLYASEYMERDEGYGRFFGLLDLFLGNMLLLVLADSLLLLFAGWEGVGVCSYLLIGFWWQHAANGAAARKAFLVTRFADLGLALAVYLLATRAHTLDFVRLAAPGTLTAETAGLAGLLLLLAAVGKSGQVPLHVWLPDAMAGPTPVSAMIHAATMVAAGVYLLSRMSPVLAQAPEVLFAVTVIGTVTLVIAGLAAIAQTDIKRVLAYSTVSQLGYMFVAVGAGAPEAATFHFFTHACFKALLFLAAGAVIEAAHHTQDLRRLGGLAPDSRFLYGVFGAGVASLAALPVVTAGFWSKDLILAEAWASPTAGPVFAVVGVLGGLLTATYSFRLFFLLFHGERRDGIHAHDHSGLRMRLPLALLAVAALALGPTEHAVVSFLAGGHAAPSGADADAGTVMALSAVASLAGAGFAWARWGRVGAMPSPTGAAAFAHGGLGFDAFYAATVQRPLVAIAGTNRWDPLDVPVLAVAEAARLGNVFLHTIQSGRVGTYLTVALLSAAGLLVAGVSL